MRIGKSPNFGWQKIVFFRKLLAKIPFGTFGIFIGASDTFECFNALNELNLNADIILFGHKSDENTATRHGVYVLNDDGELEKVWQKPSIDQLKSLNGGNNYAGIFGAKIND